MCVDICLKQVEYIDVNVKGGKIRYCLAHDVPIYERCNTKCITVDVVFKTQGERSSFPITQTHAYSSP